LSARGRERSETSTSTGACRLHVGRRRHDLAANAGGCTHPCARILPSALHGRGRRNHLRACARERTHAASARAIGSLNGGRRRDDLAATRGGSFAEEVFDFAHPALHGGRRGDDSSVRHSKGPLVRDGADVRRRGNYGCLRQSGRVSSGTAEIRGRSNDGSPVCGQVQAGASGGGQGHGWRGAAVGGEIRRGRAAVQIHVWGRGVCYVATMFARDRERVLARRFCWFGMARLAAFGRRCGASGRVVGNVGCAIDAMLPERRFFQYAARGRGPDDQDGDQVPQKGLHEGSPRLAGVDKYVVPEQSRTRRRRDRRRGLARQRVGKIADENAIAGFEFVQQLQAGIGLGGNRYVRN
jgi:hypothetical protein